MHLDAVIVMAYIAIIADYFADQKDYFYNQMVMRPLKV